MTYLLHSLPVKGFSAAMIVTLFAVLTAIGSSAYTAHAADTCSPANCVLACNVRQRICSRFPNTQVPSGYIRVSFMPYGYRRVRQSKCDLMVCPSYVKDCRRWVPTKAE